MTINQFIKHKIETNDRRNYIAKQQNLLLNIFSDRLTINYQELC